jgi:hypothetical protein
VKPITGKPYKKGGIMKKMRNIQVFMVLSIIAMIAFAGCTGKNEPTNTTPQGAVQTPQGDVKTSELESYIRGCNSMKGVSTGGRENMGWVDYEGKGFCLFVDTDTVSGGSMETYINLNSSMQIIKDKSGKIINKAEQKKGT